MHAATPPRQTGGADRTLHYEREVNMLRILVPAQTGMLVP